MSTFRQRLHETQDRMTMHIVTIPSPAVPQAMAAAGADAVIIDMEHGAIGHAEAHALIAATQGFDCAPFVRVPRIDAADVKRVLDLGAEGIVFPLVRTAQDARDAVASMHYPPRGVRGFGPFLAHSRWGQSMPDYARDAETHLTCCLLVETRDAIDNIDAICAVDGIDLLVPAMFDLSSDMGLMGQFDHPDLLAAMARVEAAAHKAGIPLGNVGLTQDQAQGCFARGYRIIAGFDALWLSARAAETQSWCKD